ncbi:MAG: cysteine desulfurase [Alphaproteobacteria bacterium]|nr:cysteine desulfurase [Alphaproteobacteria bacterium]
MTAATQADTAQRNWQGRNSLDVERVRADFPILAREVNGKPLTFLDSAASAQKPRQVIDTVRGVYETEYANIHRGVYFLSERATANFEAARGKVQRFLNAADVSEIVFTRGGTESINLVASSWGGRFVKEGDEIVLSIMEHHSNIVPWQLLAERTGAVIKVAPIADDGSFLLDEYEKLLSPRTKIVAVTHASNALGTITPVKEIIRLAHAQGAKVLLDGCQGAVHAPVDVQDLDVDFYVITGHKLYGPSGTGALYGKKDLLDAMPPYQGGGEMILRVSFDKTEYNVVPHKFEAGTPNIAGSIGLGAAIDYVSELGIDRIAAHEAEILAYAYERIAEIDNITLYGTAPEKASILSFQVEGVHPHDVGTVLDQEGVAVRAGHHCAQPVMDRFGITGTTRASFGAYNTHADVDRLVAALAKVRELFG